VGRGEGLGTLAGFLVGFAGNTEGGDGAGLEAFEADLAATFVAAAVDAVVDALDGFVDLGQELAFAIAHPQKQGAVGFETGAVSGIGETLVTFAVHAANRAISFVKDLAFATLQETAK